jgi:chemotaxis protein methyltransferase CheR
MVTISRHQSIKPAFNARMTADQFKILSDVIYDYCGIKLSQHKKVLLESRLHKRLQKLNLESFDDYLSFLNSKENTDTELVEMTDVVTTNKTDFFRERHHFDFLSETILPKLTQRSTSLRVWSAACSTGEEPYTIAMALEEYCRDHHDAKYSLLASDISTAALHRAAMAVYSQERISSIPSDYRPKYLLRSKDHTKMTFRIVPELRAKIEFRRINLMDEVLPENEKFQIIFCRNVLIYFDRNTQLNVVRKLTNRLTPGGYLFIGHSESLLQHDLPIIQIKPTIYQQTNPASNGQDGKNI